MGLSNIEKTTDDNKLAKLKAQLKEVRDKSLTSNDQDIPTILSVE